MDDATGVEAEASSCLGGPPTDGRRSGGAKRLWSASLSFAAISFSAEHLGLPVPVVPLLAQLVAALLDLSERHLEARQLGFSGHQFGRSG